MTRKSPIKHHVRTHQRKTSHGKTTVHDHDRGHGKKSSKISKPRLHRPDQSTDNQYYANIRYIELPSESYTVTAQSYPEAIETALSIRSHITPPTEIEVTKT